MILGIVAMMIASGEIVDGVGAAAGIGAGSGVGGMTVAAVGLATGTGASTAPGEDATAIHSGAGASPGVGAATAVGSATVAAAGTSSGTGATSGDGAKIAEAPGTASGASAAAAVSASIFATFDPADRHTDILLSNGNLTVDRTGADAFKQVRSTASFTSGKWHFELHLDQLGNVAGCIVGIVKTSSSNTAFPGADVNGLGFQVNQAAGTGIWYNNGGLHSSTNPGAFAVNDTVVLEFDHDNRVARVSNGSGSFTADVAYPAGIGAGAQCKIAVGLFTTTNDVTGNFGASAFVKTPTSGFVGLS